MSKLSDARMKMLASIQHPTLLFYASLLTQLNWVADPKIPTMNINSKEIHYNPDFVEGLTLPQVVAALCHEGDHIARMTTSRRGDRNPVLWNLAHDAIINDGLKACNVPDMAMDGTWLSSFGYTTESMIASGLIPPGEYTTGEQIYDALDQLSDERKVSAQADIRNHGDAAGADGGLSEAEMAAMVEGASRIAEAICKGSTPAHVKYQLEQIKDGTVAWGERLRSIVVTILGDEDWSYQSPDQASLWRGLILPDTVGTKAPEVVIALDTSGSVVHRQAILDALVAELAGVFHTARPERVTVLYIDAAVAHADTFEDFMDFGIDDLRLTGGGGTSFDPPFEYVEEHGINPDAVIYLTDGDGSVTTSPPGYKVLWVVPEEHRFSPPFGELITVPV